MDIALLFTAIVLTNIIAGILGFVFGWFRCSRNIPDFMSKLSVEELKALASKVADRRAKT